VPVLLRFQFITLALFIIMSSVRVFFLTAFRKMYKSTFRLCVFRESYEAKLKLYHHDSGTWQWGNSAI